MSAIEEDEKIVRARVLLKKFQTKQSRRCSINESDAVLDGNDAGLINDLSSAEGSTSKLSAEGGIEESHIAEHLKDGPLSHNQQCSSGSTPIFTAKSEAPPTTTTKKNVAENEHKLVVDRSPSQQIDKSYSLPQVVGMEKDNITSLRIALAQKQQELNELQSKHRELHSHYAELHSTYGMLAEQHGQHQMGLEQIQQIRMALSVALEEKMALQNELRELKLDLQKLKENEENVNSSELYSKRQLSYSQTHHELETRLNCLLAERDHLMDTVASQSTQIEHQRKECSSLEAKFVLMQQDRIDAQGRIKSLYAINAQLEQTIEQQRSELTMRDIYIKQLTRQTMATSAATDGEQLADDEVVHQSVLIPHNDGCASTLQIHDNQQKLAGELEWHRNKALELQKQLHLVQEQHQNESAQANANATKLIKQLDTLRTQNAQLETFNNVLEERLRILQQNIPPMDDKVSSVDHSPSSINNNNNNRLNSNNQQNFLPENENSGGIDQLVNAVTELTKENENMTKKLHETELMVQQKEHNLGQIQQSLAVAQSRIVHLEQLQNIQSTINTDVSLLSSQLQNEKATVSRAVAQNVELKSQLKELQDRLVAVINESASKEDERLTALATVKRLTKQPKMNTSNDAKLTGTNDNNNNGTSTMISDQENDEQMIFKTSECDPTIISQTLTATTVSTMTDETITNSIFNQMSSCDVGLQTDAERDHGEQIDVVVTTPGQQQLVNREIETKTLAQINNEQQHQQQLPEEKDCTIVTNINNNKNNLVKQMEALCHENTLYRRTNERLEYWLTALESENESIGEYIALYRFQRTQIQQRIAQKDATLQQLQQQNTQLTVMLNELRGAILTLMQKNGGNINANTAKQNKTQPSSDNPVIDESNEQASHHHCVTSADQTQTNLTKSLDASSIDHLMHILGRSEVISRKATCTAVHQAQIHCTGCVECQGEMFNL